MNTENWVDIPGYEGLYQASDKGNIKSFYKNKKVLSPSISIKGYYKVVLYKNGGGKDHFVHRIIALSFLGNEGNLPQVNHRNGIKIDNRVVNLEWCTSSFNMKHSFDTGLHIKKKGIDNTLSIQVEQYSVEGILIKVWGSIREVEKFTSIDHSSISKCCRRIYKYRTAGGFIWKYAS